jgi:hypothetical protein
MSSDEAKPASGPRVRTALSIFYGLPVLLVLGICTYLVWAWASHQPPPIRHLSSKPFATVPIAGLTANLFTQGDALRASGNDLFIEFRDVQGNLADVGNLTFELALKMPNVQMHSISKVFRTATPGQYRTSVDPQMSGDWTAQIGFSGPRGSAGASFPVTVK